MLSPHEILQFLNFNKMAILTKVYRDNREKSQNLYYGRAVILNTLGTNDLAEIIQNNCTVKKSDVVAVLMELVEVMTAQLQNSNAVRLDGFGTFKIGLKTHGAASAKEFSCDDNVDGFRCNFTPIGKKDVASGKMKRVFTDGCRAKKYQE